MYKPKDIETGWIKIETAIATYLTQKKWFKPFLFFVAIVFAVCTFNLWTQTRYPTWSRFNLIQDRLFASYVILFSSFIPLFFARIRNSSGFLLLVVTASWLVPTSFLGSVNIASTIPIIYILLSALVVELKFLNKGIKLVALVALFIGMVSVLTRDSLNSGNYKIILYFSNLHMDISLLYFIGALFNTPSFSYQMHFNPVQFLSPTPMPERATISVKNIEYETQCVRGWLGILQVQVVFLILIGLLKLEPIFNTVNPFIHYIFFLAIITGLMKMISSFLWIYGFQTVSSTYFLILAKSPIEVWQRGAVFIADFLFNKIYLPTWKVLRNTFYSSIATILAIAFHLFIFHELIVKFLLRLQFGNAFFGNFGWSEIKLWVFWFGIWILWICIFAGLKKLFKTWHENTGFQWAMILLTHLGSALIIPLTNYLSTII